MDQQTQGNPIRLLLVDEQALFRASLGKFLALQPGLEVVSECGNATEALDILNNLPVDIVLLDLELRAERRDELMAAGRRAGYKGHFLVIAGSVDARCMADALKLDRKSVV